MIKLFLVVIFLIFFAFGLKQSFKYYTRKYYSDIKIDKSGIVLNNQFIKYDNILKIYIEEDVEEITLSDRFFANDTGRLIVDKIIFQLDNGLEEYITTRRRYHLHKILCKISKYKKLSLDVNKYREPLMTEYEWLSTILLFVIYLIFLRNEVPFIYAISLILVASTLSRLPL